MHYTLLTRIRLTFVHRLLILSTFAFSLSNATEATSVIPIKELVKQKNDMQYTKVRNRIHLDLPPFPIASSKDSTWADPIIPETFIVQVPNGHVYSSNGIVIIDGQLVQELIWPWSKLKKDEKTLNLQNLSTPRKVAGKVAVIAQEGHNNFYHWMTEILPKLALLEEKRIEFDWLYVPKLQLPFMRETLAIFGIDPKKIIEADDNTYIEAEELIVPSFVSRSCYTPKWVADYIKEHCISAAEKIIQNKDSLVKKVFISRKKASYRHIANEDEIFSMLEPYGFKRYNLEELPFLEQVALFKNAKTIVAPHGAGLTNLLFCDPGTQVVELFQQHEDDTYWYISQVLGLRHHCIKTTDFKKNGGYTDTTISLSLMKDALKEISLQADQTCTLAKPSQN